jgi:hypothetical protein
MDFGIFYHGTNMDARSPKPIGDALSFQFSFPSLAPGSHDLSTFPLFLYLSSIDSNFAERIN